jgi:putative ABC transport system permease protein
MEIRPILSALLRNKTGPLLVALQVALSLAILANALHVVNERRTVATRPSGLLDEASTFYFSVRTLNDNTPEQMLADIKRELALLRMVPGVIAASQVSQMPLSNSGGSTSVAIDRRQQRDNAITSLYEGDETLLKTFGLKLIEGREFQAHEVTDVDETISAGFRELAIMSKPLADKLWPGVPATGKTFYFGTGEGAPAVRVVGVVERLQSAHAQVGEDGEFSVIMPSRRYGFPRKLYVVRADPAQRERVMKDAEQALRASSATPMILRVKTVEEDRKSRYRADLALSWMLVTVSVLLLLVTCLWVTQRRKQIGVRRALGARRIDILRYFIVENVMITSAGVAGGVLLGVGLNQLLVTKLEMARLPVAYLIGGALMFWVIGILAAYGPAWRAARTSPALATRSL